MNVRMMLNPASLGVGDGSKHGASAAVLGGDDIGALWNGSWQVPRPHRGTNEPQSRRHS